MKHLLAAIRINIFFMIFLGLGYPLVMTVISNGLFQDKADGSIISMDGKAMGSSLIGQKFEKAEYFWPRPSAIDYNPLPSGGSNLSLQSENLKRVVEERKRRLTAAHPESGEPPQDLLFTSASGLDPHISPAAARYQILRVAKARLLDPLKVTALVERHIEARQWGGFGEPTVNVLKLNIALDGMQEVK
ncbi:MAG: potassium-transporting ATPase subunit KdpC [Bdellovibrio sp.]|nr:potassium-transporting ATPase subunit KdpC [Bdellovibrio sp.]